MLKREVGGRWTFPFPGFFICRMKRPGAAGLALGASGLITLEGGGGRPSPRASPVPERTGVVVSPGRSVVLNRLPPTPPPGARGTGSGDLQPLVPATMWCSKRGGDRDRGSGPSRCEKPRAGPHVVTLSDNPRTEDPTHRGRHLLAGMSRGRFDGIRGPEGPPVAGRWSCSPADLVLCGERARAGPKPNSRYRDPPLRRSGRRPELLERKWPRERPRPWTRGVRPPWGLHRRVRAFPAVSPEHPQVAGRLVVGVAESVFD